MGDSAIEDENSIATEKSTSDENSGTRKNGSDVSVNESWPNLMNNFNPSNWLPLTWATSNYWGLNPPVNTSNRVLEDDLAPVATASSLAFQAASHQFLNGLFWDSFAMKALDGANVIPNFNGSNRPVNVDNKPVMNNISVPSTFLDKGLPLLPEALLFRPGGLNFPPTRSNRSRSEKRPIPDELKDSRYYERRKRNNLAAKKSRDARKMREDEVALRACFLEKENAVLKAQVATLREEAHALRQLLILQKKNNTTQSEKFNNQTQIGIETSPD